MDSLILATKERSDRSTGVAQSIKELSIPYVILYVLIHGNFTQIFMCSSVHRYCEKKLLKSQTFEASLVPMLVRNYSCNGRAKKM